LPAAVRSGQNQPNATRARALPDSAHISTRWSAEAVSGTVEARAVIVWQGFPDPVM